MSSSLATGEVATILGTVVHSGSHRAELGDLFEASGDASSKHLQIETKQLRLDSVAAALTEGFIELYGDGGDAIGQGLRGGKVWIHGSVGDLAGAGMRGGQMVIKGNAGNHLGGISPASGRAMRGGDIFALSDVGDSVGTAMRRGIIYIAGSAGASGASRMIAGTIVAMKRIGGGWANGMQRGSIILGEASGEEWAALLSAPREFELSFLPILWKYLHSHCNMSAAKFPSTRWAKRQVGDLACDGMGEVLTLSKLS